MGQPLWPLKENPYKKVPRFSVCDIEASDWIQFLVIGACFKTYDDDEKVVDKVYHYFTNMAEYCDFVFSEGHPYKLIFAHFGGIYDFQFILKEFFLLRDKYMIHSIIPRGSGMLSFKVSTFTVHDLIPAWAEEKDNLGKTRNGKFKIRDKTIEFRDSSAILPFKLATLTKNFKVEHKKLEIDYDSIKEVTPQLLEYLEYDCWGLYEVLDVYFNQPLVRSVGGAATSTSQALRVFQSYLDEPIYSLRSEEDQFVRSSYFGGRTEIFKPFFYGIQSDPILRSYDVNSLYPYVMRELEMPGSFKKETRLYLENQMGFYDVEVTVPEMYVPPLGMRYKGMENRLIFPTGTFRGIWSTAELNYAESVGVKIHRVYRGMIFNNIGKIFERYINDMYATRKRSEKNSVDDILSKLFMNGTYGRMALNIEREQLEFFDGSTIGSGNVIDIPLGTKDDIVRLIKNPITLDTSFTNVAIGAWVTSGARIHMHKLIQEASEKMYYMDTDSLKTTHMYPRNDKNLGELKLEVENDRAYYLLPKTYMENATSPIYPVYDEKGNEIPGRFTSKKVVAKGMDKKKIQVFTDEDFSLALEGDMRRLRSFNEKKFAKLRTAIARGGFLALMERQERQIRTRYNKRRLVRRPYAQVYDTEPLHIKNGVVTNLDADILKKWKDPDEEDAAQVEAKYFEKLKARFK